MAFRTGEVFAKFVRGEYLPLNNKKRKDGKKKK